MAATQRPATRPRPVYLDLFAIRKPIPAIVSILHRASGALLFAVGIPALLWGVQASLAAPESYASFRAFVGHPLAKLVALALTWAYLHHLFAGFRHLTQDLHVGLDLAPARRSAAAVFAAALLVTLIVAIRLW
jgi:succinate dehydrogenase / fumarate reductase cytochrome b subunit